MKAILTLLPLLLPMSALAGAQLLGPLTDTIPPLPPPPPDLPEVSKTEIVNSETVDLGDRKIIFQEVTPSALPALPDPPIPAPQPSKPPLAPDVLQARINEIRIKQRERQMKTPQISAVVYHSQAFGGQVRTLFSLRKLPAENATMDEPLKAYANEFMHENQPLYEGPSIYFWSTIDANLLSQLPHWQSNDGTLYEGLQLSVNNIDLDQRTAFYSSRGRVYPAPQIPEIPPSPESFLLVAGQAVPEEAAAIQAIHELYAAEYGRLKVACDSRSRALLEREHYLKINPPKPPDVTFRFRILDAEETKTTSAINR